MSNVIPLLISVLGYEFVLIGVKTNIYRGVKLLTHEEAGTDCDHGENYE